MATNCLIDDYVLRKRSSMLFNEANFEAVKEVWNEVDEVLPALWPIKVFDGKNCLSELDPSHFKLLITDALNKRDRLASESHLFDNDLPIVRRLYKLLMGLIYCMQLRTGGTVDTMRVMRMSDIDVTFEFTITMIAEKKKEPPKSGLQVIVDNTK